MKSYYGGPIRTHQRSFERYHPWPPAASSSPRLGVRSPIQNSYRYYLRNGWSDGLKIWPEHSRVHPNTSPLTILEKRERGRIQGLPRFLWVPSIISGTGKAKNFKFCTHIHSIRGKKSLLKISGKVATGMQRPWQSVTYAWNNILLYGLMLTSL